MSPWFKGDPGKLDDLKRELADSFPRFKVIVGESSVCVRGVLPVLLNRKQISTYRIEVELGAAYPDTVPVVREIDGKIARIADRHINDGDGTACLFLIDERWRHYPPGTSITQFLQGPVTQFFIGQTYFDLTKTWIFGERAHFTEGTLDYYREELGVHDAQKVIACLKEVSSDHFRGHFSCPCGSGKTTRECHFDRFMDLQNRVGLTQLNKAVIGIADWVKSN